MVIRCSLRSPVAHCSGVGLCILVTVLVLQHSRVVCCSAGLSPHEGDVSKIVEWFSLRKEGLRRLKSAAASSCLTAPCLAFTGVRKLLLVPLRCSSTLPYVCGSRLVPTPSTAARLVLSRAAASAILFATCWAYPEALVMVRCSQLVLVGSIFEKLS